MLALRVILIVSYSYSEVDSQKGVSNKKHDRLQARCPENSIKFNRSTKLTFGLKQYRILTQIRQG